MANTSSWMTSFYWQQDLRSYYMNGLLNASLHPGVYNSDIAVFTTAESNTGLGIYAGLNLYIKKGTTLVFSNGYKKNNGKIERDLGNVGSYLIKSYAAEDTVINLINLSGEDAAGNPKNTVFGLGAEKENGECYVIARMLYNKKGSLGSGKEDPEFFCFFKNPSSSGEKYFSSNGLNDGESGDAYLPDGQASLGATDEYISYLILGVITPAGKWNSYLETSGDTWNESNKSKWSGKHIFLGRGLPDYRYPLLSDCSTMSPDVLINLEEENDSTTYKSIILDLRDVILNGEVFNNTSDIEDIYQWGGKSKGNNSYLEVSVKEYTESELLKQGTGLKVACDLLYLSVKLKYSNREDSLTNIFSAAANNYSLKSFAWISALRSEDSLAPDTETIRNNFISNSVSSETLSYSEDALKTIFSEGIVPLDLSNVNQTRLLNFVRNKNILSPVINAIRHENLDAEEDTIVPIALVFRPFRAESSGVTFLDGVSSASSFNPANLLSLLDLQYKAHKINTFNANVDNVYSVLPTLE